MTHELRQRLGTLQFALGTADLETAANLQTVAARDAELGTSGMRLGLSIVAKCVEALNGSIRVESSPGEGITFFLELPFASAS